MADGDPKHLTEEDLEVLVKVLGLYIPNQVVREVTRQTVRNTGTSTTSRRSFVFARAGPPPRSKRSIPLS